jgi:hypothetical protein
MVWAIVTEIATNVIVLGAAAFVLRGFFQQLLARDVEHFKARLQAENDQARLNREHEMQTRLFEYQTRFSLLHQRRSEAMIELYGMLTDTNEWIKHVADPVQMVSDEQLASQTVAAIEKYNQLAGYFLKHRPYFDEDVCRRMDTVLEPLKRALHVANMVQRRNTVSENMLNLWQQASSSLKTDLPPLIEEIERDFRQSLSVGIVGQKG